MEHKIRKSAVAGTFYPGDKETLVSMVKGYLDNSSKKNDRKPVALIAPHAGYIFSGKIAADAYRQALDYKYDTIVVLGSNHTVAGFRGVSVYRGAYETPIGKTLYCSETAEEIVNSDNRFVFEESAHIREHSIEVQIPFIQTVFPESKTVMVVVGAPEPDLCEKLGEVLTGISGKRSVLIVASSDLSHFPEYEDAVEVDGETLKSIASLDIENFIYTLRRNEKRNLVNLATCACGEAPIMAAMNHSKNSGVKNGEIISYANSGDTDVGDRSRVVGYGAVVF